MTATDSVSGCCSYDGGFEHGSADDLVNSDIAQWEIFSHHLVRCAAYQLQQRNEHRSCRSLSPRSRSRGKHRMRLFWA